MIYVENKKRKIERIEAAYPGAIVLDITSSSPHRYGQILSPFFPHGNIPIPGESRGMTATCVEAIWQGLKIFEREDIDISMFRNDTMKNIKRTVRKYGRPLGHRFGIYSNTILDYADARRYIYIPSYKYVLDNIPEVHKVIERIKQKAKETDIVLLDYNQNPDNRDLSKPLSHAELVKMYIEDRYPVKDEDFIPYTQEELNALKKQKKTRDKGMLSIDTPDQIEYALSKISEVLSCSERSSKEIKDMLHINARTADLNRIIEGIPGIKIRKEKRTRFFTLGKQNIPPSLF